MVLRSLLFVLFLTMAISVNGEVQDLCQTLAVSNSNCWLSYGDASIKDQEVWAITNGSVWGRAPVSSLIFARHVNWQISIKWQISGLVNRRFDKEVIAIWLASDNSIQRDLKNYDWENDAASFHGVGIVLELKPGIEIVVKTLSADKRNSIKCKSTWEAESNKKLTLDIKKNANMSVLQAYLRIDDEMEVCSFSVTLDPTLELIGDRRYHFGAVAFAPNRARLILSDVSSMPKVLLADNSNEASPLIHTIAIVVPAIGITSLLIGITGIVVWRRRKSLATRERFDSSRMLSQQDLPDGSVVLRRQVSVIERTRTICQPPLPTVNLECSKGRISQTPSRCIPDSNGMPPVRSNNNLVLEEKGYLQPSRSPLLDMAYNEEANGKTIPEAATSITCEVALGAGDNGITESEKYQKKSPAKAVKKYKKPVLESPRESTGPLILNDIAERLPYDKDRLEIAADRLKIIKAIASGAFGVISRGQLLLDEHPETEAPRWQTVAIKKARDPNNQDQKNDLECELKLLANIGPHPNIVALCGAVNINGGDFTLVLEFCAGGCLHDFLCKNQRFYRDVDDELQPRQLTRRNLVVLAQQVASGMAFVHTKNCVHRDLAARNILLDKSGTVAKITDFGLARHLYKEGPKEGPYKSNPDKKVPLAWYAPEVLKNFVYLFESDIWSFGVLLWEIFSLGERPWRGEKFGDNFLARLKSGRRLCRASCVDNELDDIMGTCWQYEPEDRPKFAILSSRLNSWLQKSESPFIVIKRPLAGAIFLDR